MVLQVAGSETKVAGCKGLPLTATGSSPPNGKTHPSVLVYPLTTPVRSQEYKPHFHIQDPSLGATVPGTLGPEV